MKHVVNFPLWGEFELVHDIGDFVRDGEWSIALGGQFRSGVSGF